MPKKQADADFPTASEVLEFVKTYPDKVTKREIARAFGIKGPDKVQLKKLLRHMQEDGLILQDERKSLRAADELKAVQVVEFIGTDDSGDVLLRPVNFPADIPCPVIYMTATKDPRKGADMGPGDQALVRLHAQRGETVSYKAKVIKMLKAERTDTILGIYHGDEKGGRVHPVDKKNRFEMLIEGRHVAGAEDGELVVAELLPKRGRTARNGARPARIREKMGDVSQPRSISLIAIHAYDIPHEFPDTVIKEAESAIMVKADGREDLRDIPLITIDPVDARDHDDAIWAEPDTDPDNVGGWHTIVAIADVAYYVRAGGDLDREAYKRGNSCYFPDRVVPMLPEALSAGLCSLKPHEERACMAVHMWFDAKGNKTRHKFVRGIMRSAANIEYKRVQEAVEGRADDEALPLLDTVIKPLYGAYAALVKERSKRQPLDLDMPEKKVVIGEDGMIAEIAIRDRLDAHRLVEEFMIAANVCAAEELEKHKVPAMYRVHEEPSMEKIESLREFLDSLDLSLAKGAVLMPRLFNGILKQVKNTPHELMVNQVVLRSQRQATYTPDNQGHFGLALTKYAHFTSPIRRYSDLIVHRGLVRALGLGDDGLTDDEIEKMEAIGEHISTTERRAMSAERDSTDRYMAAYMSAHVGDTMWGRISSVTRFGIFVAVEPSGGEGLIPISDLGGDYYVHDEAKHQLVGERTGAAFSLGDRMQVRLLEANKFSGGMRLEIVDHPDLPDFVTQKPKRPHKGGRGKPTRKHEKKQGKKFGNKGRAPLDKPNAGLSKTPFKAAGKKGKPAKGKR